MATRLRLSVFLILVSAVTGGLLVGARRGPAPPQLPGVAGGGATLLPNGWTIQPAGTHLIVGGLPLNLVETPDHRYAVITNNGLEKPTLTMVDLKLQMVAATVPVDNAWYGLAWDPDGTRLYSAGGAENAVYVFSYEKGTLTSRGKIPLGEPEIAHGWPQGHPSGFTGGLAVSPDGRRLYALQMLGGALTVVDLDKRAVLRRIDLGAEPYAVALSPDASTLYVSIWGGAKVAVFDARSLERLGEIATDEHPNAMVFSKDGRRLFVACANRNTVWTIDTSARKAIEQVSVALFPHAPAGSTPNALALSPDGETLAVANADNNTVALVDVGDEGASEVEGFIPTGWYPTGVRFDQEGRRLLVLSGKGLMSQANPRGANGGSPGMAGQYSGGMMQGAISFVPMPDTSALAAMTKRVYALTPYTDAGRLAPPDAPRASSIPREVGGASPIRHVFYIIRENRTYDQVLGDAPAGNGDPNLALFGEKVTPNAHAITRQFVLFDNFYVNAEVSYDGHAYSTAAYATDFVEKMWPTNYGGRGGLYLSEGGYERRNAFGNIAAPADGYIWDFANRAGVSVRSYGEFAERGGKGQPARATVPGLEGKVCPDYEPWDLQRARRAARGRMAEGVPRVRGERPAAAPQHPAPRRRPHVRHAAGRPHAARHGGRERLRARPDCRGDLEEPLLEGVGRLRPGGRRAERPGPRGRAPFGAARGEPVRAPRRDRLDALHHRVGPADDGADPRPAADEPVRRGRAAALRRVHDHARARALRAAAGADVVRRAERARRARRRGVDAHELRGGRPRAGPRAQPGDLGVGPRRRRRDAAAGARRVRARPGGPGRQVVSGQRSGGWP